MRKQQLLGLVVVGVYLDPPFGCQFSAPNGLFLVGFLGLKFHQISDPWRIQVVQLCFCVCFGLCCFGMLDVYVL